MQLSLLKNPATISDRIETTQAASRTMYSLLARHPTSQRASIARTPAWFILWENATGPSLTWRIHMHLPSPWTTSTHWVTLRAWTGRSSPSSSANCSKASITVQWLTRPAICSHNGSVQESPEAAVKAFLVINRSNLRDPKHRSHASKMCFKPPNLSCCRWQKRWQLKIKVQIWK